MKKFMRTIASAAMFVVTELCLEIRQVTLEVFAETLNAIVTAMFK